jgi:amino acid adenylation domain-containing protein
MNLKDDLSKRRSELSSAKRALLEQRLRGRGGTPEGDTIPKRPADVAAPLSFAQQRLWFLQQLEPESPAYNEPKALHMTGVLHMPAMTQALSEVVRRHEVLRTTFPMVDGQPSLVIDPLAHTHIRLPVLDLGDLNEADQAAEVRRRVADEAQRPFDLAQELPWRITVLRLHATEHVVLLTMHHIISDGWSVGILTRELVQMYNSVYHGHPPSLPVLPIQYADFAYWQRQWLQGATLATQLAYWTNQLAGPLPVLHLPTDHPHSNTDILPGRNYPFVMPDRLAKALLTLSHQEGVTLFMTLLAAFKTLLYRYTGQEDVVVGSPIAGRTRPEVEGLIGFFINTLVLRTKLNGNLECRELLQRVRAVALEAYAHQDLPFEKLVEELQPERSLRHSPFFQVMFILQNFPPSTGTLPELEIRDIEADTGAAKFDLTLVVEDREQELRGYITYNTDVFEASTIERMVGHYFTLLEAMVANPAQRLSDLPLLSQAEQHCLAQWNATDVPYPDTLGIHHMFEAQAGRTPGAIAIVCGAERMTYQELNRRADQVADGLRALGVGPEVPVGLYLDRSVALVVGLLGILKAGGAYVPLDPAYPQERVAFMLEDAQTTVLLTQQHLVEKLPQGAFQDQCRVVCLDRAWPPIAQARAESSLPLVSCDNLAYIIYTSGSTGRPKGVAITHRSAVAFVQWAQTVFSFDELAGVLAATSICFDLSVFELFVPLSVGGTAIIAENALALPELPPEPPVTLVNTVPSAMTELVHHVGIPSSVRTINLAGEPLPLRLVEQLFQREHVRRVLNLYGPSEDTTYSTWIELERDADKPPTIGRPIHNTQVAILDALGMLTPIGVPGELHLGGVGLARGYLNRPHLTAERFVPDQFSGRPGARLYRTGDLARYLPDGTIEYLGRIDHQIKLRGFRIELSEIEAVLSRHPAVREAVVVVREDGPASDGSTDKRLVAYCTTDQPAPSLEALRQVLKQHLPEYMLPSAIMILDALPLTANGKVDRSALPKPDTIKTVDAGATLQSPAQEVMAGIWAGVLGVDRVGLHDNFFELGGHSLLATQVMSRVRQTFQVALPVRRLFELPTVAELTTAVEAATRATTDTALPPIVAVPRDHTLPLSIGQRRLWGFDRALPNTGYFNISSSVRITGDLDREIVSRCFDTIIQRHEILRVVFEAVDGQPVQVLVPATSLPLTWIDLSDLPEAEQATRLLHFATGFARLPFNLAHGPLLRAALLRMGPQDHVLLLTMHHIISDGWSVGVFMRDLLVVYEALAQGGTADQPGLLPHLPIQYADFVAWQSALLQAGALQAQLAYWRQQLEGSRSLSWPGHTTRPTTRSFRYGRQRVVVPETLVDTLRRISHREGVSLFMTFLAVLQTLLYDYTGQDDIKVGTLLANRTQLETEALIGLFINTVILRTRLSPSATFRELLGQVCRTTLDAYAHQELPFDQVVEALQADENQESLFQVLFIFQNMHGQHLQGQHLTITGLPIEDETRVVEALPTTHDLILEISEESHSLAILLKYKLDLFDPQTGTHLIQRFITLLNRVSSQLDRSLTDLLQ